MATAAASNCSSLRSSDVVSDFPPPAAAASSTASIPDTLAAKMHDIVLHADDTIVIAIRYRPVPHRP